MLLMLDNYDSFTYNLVHYFTELGIEVITLRNDNNIDLKYYLNIFNFNFICISPGPGGPRDSCELCLNIIKYFYNKKPIIGICLGHQAIGYIFNYIINNVWSILHGKVSNINYNKNKIYNLIINPYINTRYHSLIIEKTIWSILNKIKILSWIDQVNIMAIKHINYNLYGFQFHPESILSKLGHNLLNNFLIDSFYV